MKRRFSSIFASFAGLLAVVCIGTASLRADESPYKLVWDSPSSDWNGTVPLGNGEVGVNLWYDAPAGTLRLLLSRTDSWDEFGRLAKVAQVDVSGLNAAPWSDSTPFVQTLDVERGDVALTFGAPNAQTRLRVWVETSRPNVVVEIDSDAELAPEASFSIWRGENRENLGAPEVSDLFYYHNGEAVVRPDVLLDNDALVKAGRIAVCRRNVETPYFAEIGKTQGLDDFPGRVDPLKDRAFGALVSCDSCAKVASGKLIATPGKTCRFEIVALTLPQSSSVDAWLDEASKIADKAQNVALETRRDETLAYWRDFSERSWLRFSPNKKACASLSDAERAAVVAETFDVTRAYALQRYVFACEGRGNFPIKFNGGIFTVQWQNSPGKHDYRRWGPGYWFQNTRLPYYSFLSGGDWDLMKPFFDMYCGLVPFCEYRVKKYFGESFEGAYFPECIYFWGDVFPETYGQKPWNERNGDPLQTARWHKWEWVGGLEIAQLALQYYEYALDEEFLARKAIPTANAVLKFYDSYYSVDPASGKLKLSPSQALETWQDCDDPATEVAGIRSVLGRLLALPEDKTSADDRAYWRELLAKTPEVPTIVDEASGKTKLAPAARFDRMSNVETPECYPVFPFRLFAFDLPNADWARLALETRKNRLKVGWNQDDLFYSYLGDREGARELLVYRARTKHSESRFLAFWGPNFDWNPDQTHGGVLNAAAQSLVLQTTGRKIWLAPALPKTWDVEFKLHAPEQTTLEGRIVDGEVAELNVEPKERAQDVEFVK